MSASHGWSLVDQQRKQDVIEAIRSGSTPTGPAHVELDLTDRCNVACYFCNQMDVRTRESIPLDKVASILDELTEGGLKSVRLSGGGDPLMYKHFGDVQDALAERGVVIDNLTTNGALLKEELAEKLVRHRAREVIFSLNAVDAHDYQRMMKVGGKVFHQVTENLRRLVELRGEEPLPTIIVQFLLDPHNYHRLPDMYALGRDIGVDRITLNAVLEIPRERLEPESLLRPKDHDLVRPYVEEVLKADRDRGLMQIFFPWEEWNAMVAEVRAKLAAPAENPFPTASTFREDAGHCFFGWYTASIRGTGEMYPCCMLMNPDYEPLGNALDGGALHQWRDGRFKKLRRDMREVFLTGGRIFNRRKRMDTLMPQCIEAHRCGLKNMYFRQDEDFYRQLGEAVDEMRKKEVRWVGGGFKASARAAEILAYRVVHGTLVRGRAVGRKLKGWVTPMTNGTPRRERLHVGCGDKHLDGWVNIDHQKLPGVDVVADVTDGLKFSNAEAVYAEHFLEHLPILAVLSFFGECHRVLGDDGVIRLSTPNLDWVWLTHYRLEGASPEEKSSMAININRAFHGWEHQFLWNREMLTEALEACGFTDLSWHRYGKSGRDVFRGLERHETYEDSEALPHVLIVEAVKGEAQPERLAALKERIQANFLNHMKA